MPQCFRSPVRLAEKRSTYRAPHGWANEKGGEGDDGGEHQGQYASSRDVSFTTEAGLSTTRCPSRYRRPETVAYRNKTGLRPKEPPPWRQPAARRQQHFSHLQNTHTTVLHGVSPPPAKFQISQAGRRGRRSSDLAQTGLRLGSIAPNLTASRSASSHRQPSRQRCPSQLQATRHVGSLFAGHACIRRSRGDALPSHAHSLGLT